MISDELRMQVCQDANYQCGYCLSFQKYVLAVLELDHIIPKAKGGRDERENLWLACRLCNGYKGTQIEAIDPETQTLVKLFNPRTQIWSEHFEWIEQGHRVRGKTPCGRATVVALKLNNVIAVTVRTQWVIAGWHPSNGIDLTTS